MLSVGPAPEGEYVRMFEEQQLFGSFTGAKTLNCAFLQAEPFVVRNEPSQLGFTQSRSSLRCLCDHDPHALA